MTGGQAIVRTLRAQGVRYVFGNPGTYEIELLDAVAAAPDIEYILSLHESATVAMADGYARLTGDPAFVNIHAMVGTSNGLGAIFAASEDRVPLVVTAGAHATQHLYRRGQGESMELAGMVRPHAKHSLVVPRADRIPEEIVRAFKIAGTPPAGPAFVGIPRDFFPAETEFRIPDPAGFRISPRVSADAGDIARAADLLVAAERPVLVAGGEVWGDGAAPLLEELADLLALPTYNEHFQSVLGFRTTHPLYQGQYSPGDAFAARATLLLGVGCRLFVEPDAPKEPMIAAGAKVVHIHKDPWEVARLYETDVPIVADSRSALDALLAEVRKRITRSVGAAAEARREAATEAARARNERRRADLGSEAHAHPLKPWRVVAEMNRVLPDDAMIVNQAVTMGNYILGLGELRAGGHAMTSSTYMGWAAGAPLGMKLAAPKRAVLSCLGDGGLIFGAQALWTAARYGIPVVYCVFDNSAYMAIKSSLVDRDGAARRAGAFPGSELHGPSVDLVKLAESFGVAARRVDRAGDVRGALEWALGAGGPVVLDFVIDRAELGAHRAAPAAEKARA